MSPVRPRYPKLEFEGPSPRTSQIQAKPKQKRKYTKKKTPEKSPVLTRRALNAAAWIVPDPALLEAAERPPPPKPKTPRKTREISLRTRREPAKIPTASQAQPKNMIPGSSPMDELNQKGELVAFGTPRRQVGDFTFTEVRKKPKTRGTPKQAAAGSHSGAQNSPGRAQPLKRSHTQEFSGSGHTDQNQGGEEDHGQPEDNGPPSPGSPPPPPPDPAPSDLPDSNECIMTRKDVEKLKRHAAYILNVTYRCLQVNVPDLQEPPIPLPLAPPFEEPPPAGPEHYQNVAHSPDVARSPDVEFRTPLAGDSPAGLVLAPGIQLFGVVLAQDTPDQDEDNAVSDDDYDMPIPILEHEFQQQPYD